MTDETELEHLTEAESYSPDWAAIRWAAAVIVAVFLAVVGVVLYAS